MMKKGLQMAHDLDDILAEEGEALKSFSEDVRAEMKALIEDMERDFTILLEKLLQGEVANFEKQVQSILAAKNEIETSSGSDNGGFTNAGSDLFNKGFGGIFNESFSTSSGSIIGRTLNSALNNAVRSVLKTGKINSRSVIRAGANVAGRAIGKNIAGVFTGSSKPSFRLSRGQIASEALSGLGKGQRDS
jgi:hypothetical protein